MDRSTGEKITDAARGAFEKATGYETPSPFPCLPTLGYHFQTLCLLTYCCVEQKEGQPEDLQLDKPQTGCGTVQLSVCPPWTDGMVLRIGHWRSTLGSFVLCISSGDRQE